MATESSAVVRFINVARQQRHTIEGLEVPDLSSDLQRELTQKVRRWPGRLAWSMVWVLAAAMTFGLLYLYNQSSRTSVPSHAAAVATDPASAGGDLQQPSPVVTPLATEQPAPDADKAEESPEPRERRAEEPAREERERPARRRDSRTRAADAEPPVAKAQPIAALTPNWNDDANLPTGTLMVGAKPPCQIYIDGRATGLMTPQRTIELPAGNHRVELVNEQQGLRKTFKVKIAAGKTTRAVVDLLQ